MKSQQKRLNRPAEGNADKVSVINKPILADLEVLQLRLTAVYKTTNEDISSSMVISSSSESNSKRKKFLVSATESMKNEAVNRAQFYFMEQNKCDYLVDPIYKVETETESGSSIVNITVTVSAFPASFKKFVQPDSLPKSVFQLRELNTRELPLMTNSIKSEVQKMKSESGVVGIPSLGAYTDDVNYLYSDLSEDSTALKKGFNFCGGFYHVFPLGSKLGLRLEGLVGYRRFKSEYNYTFGSTTNRVRQNSFVNLEVPLFFDLKLADAFHINVGYSIGVALSAKYKETEVVTDVTGSVLSSYEINKSYSTSDVSGLQSYFILGAQYELDSGLGLGVRYTTGLWNSIGLTVGYAF